MKQCATIIGLTACCLLLIASAALAGPKTELSEDTFDFGYVVQRAKVSHDFWIKSVGDDSLKIVKVIPGCGCTQVPLEKRDIASGDSAKLEIIFSTGLYQNEITKGPRIKTNEGQAYERISITANVMRYPDSTSPLVMKPFRIHLIPLNEETSAKQSFTITNVSDQDLELTLIAAPTALFTVDLPKKIKAGETKTVNLEVKKDAAEQAFEKSITIAVNDQEGTRFTVPVVKTLRQRTVSQ